MLRLKTILLSYFAKTLAYLSRALKKGSGTSLPGLVIEKYFIDILGYIGKDFEQIIFISGTNGKTTTRAILVDIYEQNGVQVCTNRGGANILRGVASSLLLNLDGQGRNINKIAILEVEEASLPKLCKYILPDKLILTNIFRDQLDAYGEIDKTLHYFEESIKLSSKKPDFKLYLNSDDKKLLKCVNDFKGKIYGFGLNLPLAKKPQFESTEDIEINFSEKFIAYNIHGNNFQVATGDNKIHKINLKLPGTYNIYNALAAFLPAYEEFGTRALDPIMNFEPVFGRGEEIQVGESRIKLMLVKNPAGFNQVLNYISDNNQKQAINLAVLINDKIADGKDVSWLWDIDLEDFVTTQPINQIYTGGTRGLDILLRFEYANSVVNSENYIENLDQLLNKIMEAKSEFIVLSTYTALLEFRKLVSTKTTIKNIDSSGN